MSRNSYCTLTCAVVLVKVISLIHTYMHSSYRNMCMLGRLMAHKLPVIKELCITISSQRGSEIGLKLYHDYPIPYSLKFLR